MAFKDTFIDFIHELQDAICAGLEEADGLKKFVEDAWTRSEGGGGKTRVLSGGNVIEKGGVNTSIVYGEVTDLMRKQLKMDGHHWFACGMSLVIHPRNPFVPTVHANYRMFELYNEDDTLADRWFGGGTDLTPYYLDTDDVYHFHNVYKKACDLFDPEFYSRFKAQCDGYFVNWHRNEERRGVGGIFYDYCREEGDRDAQFWLKFARSCGFGFLDAYLPLVEKNKGKAFNEANKHWQEIRRGRYTEFNLVHDRGTLFGLKTNGRIESILMSLPPTVRFEYDYQPLKGSPEAELLDACLHPRDWLGLEKNI